MINRMQFLRGDFSGRTLPIRPPWALRESAFVETCQRCDDCARACPERIIGRGRGGFPEIDFSNGTCLFCAECVTACPPQALAVQADRPPWSVKAVLDCAACIAFQGVECRACADPCDTRALRFSFRPRGVGIPHVNLDTCTGCGACAQVCPAGALGMRDQSAENSQ